MRYGVFQFESPGMKADASVGIASRCSVFQVAANGTSHLRKLAPYLMMSSGMQFYFEQEVAFRLGNEAIVEYGFLAAGDFSVVSSGCVLLLVACQPMSECALWL
jgi:hypothetical protein